MDKIWDIKSASPYAFQYKFGESGGFNAMIKDDPFGYVPQGYLYAGADDKEFGGWIAINKSTGEWSVVETPINDDEHKKKAIEQAKKNVHALNTNQPFKRQFEDIEEFFNKKPTGNRILAKECTFCAYKKPCWGDIQYLPQRESKAMNPKYFWYTKVKEENVDSTE